MDRRLGPVAAHAALAPRDRLIDERRDLYTLAAELAGPPAVVDRTAPSVVDNPVTRGAVGRALAGGGVLRADDFVATSELASPRFVVTLGSHRLAIVSRGAARTLLADAIVSIARQAGVAAGQDEATRLLTEDDGAPFLGAAARIAAGIRLARTVAPELMADLLPHVAVVAVVTTGGRLGSASSRCYPGLVVVPAPVSAMEVAEALVHEGAHQKFFDLAITRDVLRASAAEVPGHRPSWSPPNTAWPLEQVLAAWHAYMCLRSFWSVMSRRHRRSVARGSLLPLATRRSAELGAVLLDAGEHLGVDGHRLLSLLVGRSPATSPPPVSSEALADLERWAGDDSLVYRRSADGERAVAGRTGDPPQLYWVSGAELDGLARDAR